MFESIIRDIRSVFYSGNMVSRLILINLMVWILFAILKIIFALVISGEGVPWSFYEFLHWFCIPAQVEKLLYQPWSLLTNIFLHEDFSHLFFNLVFLYLFGTIVGDLIGDRRVLPIYIVGGLIGAGLFMLSELWKNYSVPYALGASGAVMALAGASVTIQPDYWVRLFLLGDVKLKYIVLVLVLLDLVGIAHDYNTGGHIAHIGGFITGVFLILRLRERSDLIEPVARFFEKVTHFIKRLRYPTKPPRPHAQYRDKRRYTQNPDHSASSHTSSDYYQKKIDAILDKIKESGYDSLTQEEKDFLFNANKQS